MIILLFLVLVWKMQAKALYYSILKCKVYKTGYIAKLFSNSFLKFELYIKYICIKK